ncbi:putative amphiphysin [Paratrimastix pyriformis]|uniref:Amphiphysin n=1 Tax=Paratrimastix pyriformis TaxID=342808 RepID=A0ABQ8UEJ8_9EUKA|nr:putative amphiphysin [Paratrimastix pyriformis]
MDRFMDKMKLGVAQMQRALTDATGKGKSTHVKDRHMEVLERAFKRLDIEGTRLAKSARGVFDNMKALATSLGMFGDTIGMFYLKDAHMCECGAAFKQISLEIMALCSSEEISKYVEEDAIKPMQRYLSDFPAVYRRIDQDHIYSCDFDTARTKHQRAVTSGEHLSDAEFKLKETQRRYEEHHAAMVEDLTTLVEKRFNTVDSMTAPMMIACNTFFSSVGPIFEKFAPYMEQLRQIPPTPFATAELGKHCWEIARMTEGSAGPHVEVKNLSRFVLDFVTHPPSLSPVLPLRLLPLPTAAPINFSETASEAPTFDTTAERERDFGPEGEPAEPRAPSPPSPPSAPGAMASPSPRPPLGLKRPIVMPPSVAGVTARPVVPAPSPAPAPEAEPQQAEEEEAPAAPAPAPAPGRQPGGGADMGALAQAALKRRLAATGSADLTNPNKILEDVCLAPPPSPLTFLPRTSPSCAHAPHFRIDTRLLTLTRALPLPACLQTGSAVGAAATQAFKQPEVQAQARGAAISMAGATARQLAHNPAALMGIGKRLASTSAADIADPSRLAEDVGRQAGAAVGAAAVQAAKQPEVQAKMRTAAATAGTETLRQMAAEPSAPPAPEPSAPVAPVHAPSAPVRRLPVATAAAHTATPPAPARASPAAAAPQEEPEEAARPTAPPRKPASAAAPPAPTRSSPAAAAAPAPAAPPAPTRAAKPAAAAPAPEPSGPTPDGAKLSFQERLKMFQKQQ